MSRDLTHFSAEVALIVVAEQFFFRNVKVPNGRSRLRVVTGSCRREEAGSIPFYVKTNVCRDMTHCLMAPLVPIALEQFFLDCEIVERKVQGPSREEL